MTILTNGFALVCKNITDSNIEKLHPNKTCACDFRINTRGCDEEDFIRKATWSLLVLTILLTLMSGSFLYYQIRVKRQGAFFPATRERGLIRPRPQHAVLIITFAYNLCLLISDAFPNTLVAEVSHDIPRVICTGLASLLPVVYAIPSNENEYAIPTPNGNFLDIWSILLMIGPILCSVPLAALTGYYADIGDIENAERYFKIHYVSYSFWGGFHTLATIIFWCMLKSVLNAHMKELRERDWKMKQAKRFSRNLTVVVFLFVQLDAGLFIIFVVFGMWQHNISIFIPALNKLYLFLWSFVFVMFGFFVHVIFIYGILKPLDGPPITINISPTNTINSHQPNIDMSLGAKCETLINPVQLPTINRYSDFSVEWSQ
ncbi:7078_t:CDS:2 [Ambispora gerdemannii]|uniref:7078_t:CDS:1 n=1 Tax=Ambispora gerdemannii TaxID=144530 RepID=A0A9N9FF40_9GLOM|nr:7078_t:CDS:2 [Ambispora gerdemannii]